MSAYTLSHSGIGRFTIADNAVVQDVDLGVNFFLDESSLGKSRAQCCTELLLELNPEVDGVWNSTVTVRLSVDSYLVPIMMNYAALSSPRILPASRNCLTRQKFSP
jgi:amyloid beta precursor protein binding protein 1